MFRPWTGEWFALHSTGFGGYYSHFQWLEADDVPIVGDFDGDGWYDPMVIHGTESWCTLLTTTWYTGWWALDWNGTEPAPEPMQISLAPEWIDRYQTSEVAGITQDLRGRSWMPDSTDDHDPIVAESPVVYLPPPTTISMSVDVNGVGTGTVTSSPSGLATCSGSRITCSGSFTDGASVTFTASASGSNHFVGWTGGSCSSVTSTTCTVSSASDGLLVVANFTADYTPETRYMHLDVLGSVRAVTNNAGTSTLERHDYVPFGADSEALPAAGNDPTRFAGSERDSTKLDYMGARYYDMFRGRFTSPDPIVNMAAIVVPQKWNRYAYSRNNPLRFVDPSGSDEVPLCNRGGTWACQETGQNELSNVFDPFYNDPLGVQDEKGNVYVFGGGCYCPQQKVIGHVGDGTVSSFDPKPSTTTVSTTSLNGKILGTTVSSSEGHLDPLGQLAVLISLQAGPPTNVVLVAGAVTSGPLLLATLIEGALGSPLAQLAIEAMAKDAKLTHIFGNPAHLLDGVVKYFGSQEAAYAAMLKAAQIATRGVSAAQFETKGVVVNLGGYSVTVTGTIINGVAQIGTAFVKK